jgi:hypothetical protein
MLKANFDLYIGKDYKEGYIGYLAEGTVFLVLTVEEGLTKEQGEKSILAFKKVLLEDIHNLKDFETKIHEVILKSNLPAGFSLAAGYLTKDILYLKTAGEGQIYLRRGKQFATLISGDKSASGYLRQFDCFVFTTDRITALLGGTNDIKTFIEHNKPQDIVEKLQEEDYGEDDQGAAMLFVEFVEEKKEAEVSTKDMMAEDEDIYEKEITPSVKPVPKLSLPVNFSFTNKVGAFRSLQSNKHKRLVFIGVAVIFAILVWSVVLGSQRRADEQMDKKIAATKDTITLKLNQAEESSFLDIDKSMSLLAEARTDVANLKREVGEKKKEQVAELDKLIKDRENKIVKKEEKNFEEFYDLALENKDASGSKMYFDIDSVAILDDKKGIIYILSLEKKSLTKKSAGELKDAQLVGMYKNDVFFFNQEKGGIFKIGTNDKAQKIIANDDEWGNISDMHLYSGNIYLLDKDKQQIYKYTAVEKGYSDRNEYFSGEGGAALSSGNSLAIDSSVYVSVGDKILKYTKGAGEDFKTTYPEAGVNLSKVYTNAEIEKVYAWDKSKGIVYVMDKKGVYERQIRSSILAKGDDLVVYENSIYVLVGQKIYKIVI